MKERGVCGCANSYDVMNVAHLMEIAWQMLGNPNLQGYEEGVTHALVMKET